MQLSITTPSLIFPAVSLLMLAYTNRYIALANLIRNLGRQYQTDKKINLIIQIKNLKKRIKLVQLMQELGIGCFICSSICIFCIYMEAYLIGDITFAITIILFFLSLLVSLWEIKISTIALEIEISDLNKIVLENANS